VRKIVIRKINKTAATALLFSVFLMCSSKAYAAASDFNLGTGGKLTIEGDNFSFERYTVSTGEFNEVAVWEGNVTATFDPILLTSEKIEAQFAGDEIISMEAGPDVEIVGLNGRAIFSCAFITIDFPGELSGLDYYQGHGNDVRGYYLAHASELGLDTEEDYEINFTAETIVLGPDSATLTNPVLSLGDPERPDVAFSSHELNLPIGDHPVSGERTVLGLSASDVSLILFGHRLNVIWFPVWKGLTPRLEPGLTYPLPKIGWEGDAGFHWDQFVQYDFFKLPDGGGPFLQGRFDFFPADRSYPELIFHGVADRLTFEARTGYRREEDQEGDTVPTRAEPEITLGTTRFPVGDGSAGFKASVFYGYMRDMTLGMAGDRYGYTGVLDGRTRLSENVTARGELTYVDRYYSDSSNFATLEGDFSIRYVESPQWGATLSYRKVYRWGQPGFRYDEPRVLDEIGLEQQTRFSDRWGGGIDWSWNFAEDDFERQQCHLTYIFDSFQVSLGWDFFNESVTVNFGLPGSL
jgi:hypothetical protein